MSEQPRRRFWALAAASLAVLLVGGFVIAIGTGVFSGNGSPPRSAAPPRGLDQRTVPATVTPGNAKTVTPGKTKSPPTTADPRIIDRQPPVGPMSPLLPGGDASVGPTLIIPAIGLRAGIVAEGIDETPGDVGNLTAPESSGQVGWWDGGPAPGQGGVAVITGHRVSNWAFWRLPEVQAGDSVQVIGTNGKKTNWTVTSTQQVLKSQLPTSVWTKGGPAKLALVTCGGTFNNAIGHYNDNILVWAKPAAT